MEGVETGVRKQVVHQACTYFLIGASCSLHIRSQLRSKVFSQEGGQWKLKNDKPKCIRLQTVFVSIHPGVVVLRLMGQWFFFVLASAGAGNRSVFLMCLDSFQQVCVDVYGLKMHMTCTVVGQPSWLKTLDLDLQPFGGRAGLLQVTDNCLGSHMKVLASGAGQQQRECTKFNTNHQRHAARKWNTN